MENVEKKTVKKLPTTNFALLDGKELYRRIIPRFTSIDITPEAIYEEGLRQLDAFYAEVSMKCLSSVGLLFAATTHASLISTTMNVMGR